MVCEVVEGGVPGTGNKNHTLALSSYGYCKGALVMSEGGQCVVVKAVGAYVCRGVACGAGAWLVLRWLT